jgi:zinc D-Ala-D-Ala carboxypeptidase
LSDQLTRNFSKKEFECACCGQDDIDIELVKKLQELRMEYGSPMKVTSGVRCRPHNRAVGGAENSSHLFSIAVDIAMSDSTLRHRFVRTALAMGWKRIGIAKTFVHLDIDGRKASPVIWTY